MPSEPFLEIRLRETRIFEKNRPLRGYRFKGLFARGARPSSSFFCRIFVELITVFRIHRPMNSTLNSSPFRVSVISFLEWSFF